MNLSLSSGIVPEQMKVARVIPLFKSGILTLFANYRPISVLPAFSQFLERIIYKRLDSFYSCAVRRMSYKLGSVSSFWCHIGACKFMLAYIYHAVFRVGGG